MTIDEAIEHCIEKSDECTKCGKEHLQLAEWLKELKQLRVKEIAPCEYISRNVHNCKKEKCNRIDCLKYK